MGYLVGKLEKRASLANPDDFLTSVFGGGESNSGVSVTPESALTNTAILAAVERLSRTVASLPLITYKRLPNGGKERDPSFPLASKLHDAPNDEHTAVEFRQYQMASLLLRGKSYSFIDRNGAGKVLDLWPLNPAKVELERKSGQLIYTWKPKGGVGRTFMAHQIHHIHGLSMDGVTGLSPIGLARESIGLGLAAEEYGARFFSGGANAGGILKHPATLSEGAQKRLGTSFDQANMGLSKSHRTMVLEEGLDWTKIGVDPREAQFIELRKFQVRDAARIFGIQPHLIGDLENATFTNIESQGIEYVVYTLGYWLKLFEQAITRDLLSEQERKTHFVEFLVEGLLRGDVAARGEFYWKMFQMGAFSPNDILHLENRNSVEGGDRRYVPANMVPVNSEGLPMLPPRPESAPRSVPAAIPEVRAHSVAHRLALRPAFAQQFATVARRNLGAERREVLKNAKRHLLTRDRATFDEWLDGYYGGEFVELAQKNLEPVYRAYADAVSPMALAEADAEAMPEDFDEQVGGFAQAHANRHAKSSRGQLAKAMDEAEGEPIEAVEAELETWENRPERDGKRNGVEAGEALSRAIFTGLGLGLIWSTQGENCPLCDALDGQRVGGSNSFLNAGDTLSPPGVSPLTASNSISHAPLHDGCDCYVAPG